MGQPPILSFAIGAIEGFIAVGVFAAQACALALNRQEIPRYWRRGLVIALLLLALAVPQHVATALYLDPNVVLVDLGVRGEISRWGVLIGAGLGLLVGMGAGLIQAAWLGLMACVTLGEWGRLEPTRAVFLGVRDGRALRLGAAFTAGLLGGLLSVVALEALEVEVGPGLADVQAYFPGLAEAGASIQALLALAFVSAAAIGEEIGFRGALLGVALRLSRGRRWAEVGGVLLVTGAWALLHLSLTDAPLIKLAQIAPAGLALAWLARRHGLGAAIGAHLGFNFAALGATVLLEAG